MHRHEKCRNYPSFCMRGICRFLITGNKPDILKTLPFSGKVFVVEIFIKKFKEYYLIKVIDIFIG